MAGEVEKTRNLNEILKPFYKRASEAEERVAKLEELFARKKDDAGSLETSSIIKDFQTKLQIAQTDLLSEREKATKEIQKLTSEVMKLQYRVTHVVRALKEADEKIQKLEENRKSELPSA